MAYLHFEHGGILMGFVEKNVGDCPDSKCVECQQQFRDGTEQLFPHLTYVRPNLTPQEAEKMVSVYVNSIANDLAYLKAKIAAHGNTIISKWKKKSHQKRHDDLLVAHPSIFEQTQFLIWARYELGDWQKGRKYRNSYLLPYLSLDSLKKNPYRLFALLHARTKFSPDQWVSFDKTQTALGWGEGNLAIQYSCRTISLLGTNYGQRVAWNKAKAHQWDHCAFPRAKIILEAQFVLMGFLRKLVQLLIEDLQGESNNLRWIRLADTGFRGSVGSESWSAFTNMAFSNPTFSFDRFLDIARSHQAGAIDHLWLLQTDTAYFLDHIRMSLQGRICDQSDSRKKYSAKYYVLPTHIWRNPAREAQEWCGLVEELEHAKSIHDKFRDIIRRGESIPLEFDFAMGSLELLLVNYAQQRRNDIRTLIPQLIGFQNWFTHSWLPHGGIRFELQARAKNAFWVCYREDPLFWCMWALGNDFEQDILMNPATLFNFLDSLIAKETLENKTRLEGRLLQLLSSLIAIHEIHAAVRHFLPMCSCTDVGKVQPNGTDRVAWRTIVGQRAKYDYPPRLIKKLAVAFKTLENSTFPTGLRDEALLQRADQVRKVSKDFWATAREIQKWASDQKFGDATEEDDKAALALLSYDQAPEHLAALQAERNFILASKSQNRSGKRITEYVAPEWGSNSTTEKVSHVDSPQIKVKPKSRPKESSSINEIQQEFDTIALSSTPLLPSPTHAHLPIPVKPESIRVLTRLFPATASEYAAKALDWRTFVVAMEDAGFLATQSAGSAVAFIKEGEGRIVLHKPHPVAKIEQIWLQSWGKRMGKWFGWSRDTFVDRKEDKDKVGDDD